MASKFPIEFKSGLFDEVSSTCRCFFEEIVDNIWLINKSMVFTLTDPFPIICVSLNFITTIIRLQKQNTETLKVFSLLKQKPFQSVHFNINSLKIGKL